MINLNKHRIDFGKGDVGIGVIGNTTDSAQLAFYNQSARPIHILKNPDQNPGFEPMEFKEEPFIMSFSNPESIDAVISILTGNTSYSFAVISHLSSYGFSVTSV